MKTHEIVIAKFGSDRICHAISISAPKRAEALCDNRGFTLTELILVIAIIIILASLAIPAYSKLTDVAKVARAISEIRTIDKAINAFVIDNNRLPANQATLGEIGPEGSFKDPWGTPYQYIKIGTYVDELGAIINTNDYDLYSKGADRASATDLANPNCKDDIIRAGGGSIIELGIDYM